MARVLVTRALPEAQTTAARLAAMGHKALLSPVLEIENLPAAITTNGAQALVFTSQAGVRAAAGRVALKTVAVFAVGDATAQAARDAGFSAVQSAGAGAAELVALISGSAKPQAGAIVHVRGEDVAVDVAGALRGAGFDVREAVVYRATRAQALSTEGRDALAATPARIESVLFHSARGAEAFAQLARGANVAQACGALVALCLSARVAEAAKALAWREIRVALAPQEEALLSLV